MLVITRKEGERIVINDDIVITVVESRRGSVRIGIEAPPEMGIAREGTRPTGDALVHRDPLLVSDGDATV